MILIVARYFTSRLKASFYAVILVEINPITTFSFKIGIWEWELISWHPARNESERVILEAPAEHTAIINGLDSPVSEDGYPFIPIVG